MAKRSPIAGYNHNVKYRGLIFHVQTEDSGLLTPHLFTHLFYEGVIISTRKLVYDAGSAEDAIKGLMQAQHKVVLKDLKNGKFDDKIDVYLAGTPGLEPRSGGAPTDTPPVGVPVASDEGPPRQSEVDLILRPSDPEIQLSRPDTESDYEVSISRTVTPLPTQTPQAPRTITAERGARRLDPPPPPPNMADLNPPTDPDASGAMAAALANNVTMRTSMPPEFDSSLGSELLARTRSKHDTEVQSDGVPGAIGAMPSGRNPPNDSIPPLPPPPDKRSALAAGALPAARPVNRPPTKQAIQPPAVVSRPISDHRLVDGNRAGDSDAIEVYAPPPPSVDAPPGVASERPGQYAQHKKVSQRIPVDVMKQSPQDRSAPIPAGLARPGRPTSPPAVSGQGRPTPMAGSPTPSRAGTPSSELRVPDLASRPPERPRTPTPARLSPSSGPVVNRAPSTGSGGVVMTRPAVIVGAPAKQNVPPRVRKAREDEGRGFGQGLISEKSLDEVILAYLSEDADDK